MIPFIHNPLDRADERRTDDAWIRARLDDPATVVFALRQGPNGAEPLVRDGALARVTIADESPLFLGIRDGVAHFAIDTERECEGAAFHDFRSIVPNLSHEEAAIAATARCLFNWHRRHGFCAVCGAASRIAKSGWQRICPSCNAEHFPRVDPVVIMLPIFRGRCLLGRAAAWPPRRMSALAGFVEPGETIEEACAREVKEEAGLTATRVTYFASQPWPFPSSLMIGLFAEVESDAAVPDGTELAEVRWLTREEARAALDGEHPEVLPPSTLGISRYLIEAFARNAGLPAC